MPLVYIYIYILSGGTTKQNALHVFERFLRERFLNVFVVVQRFHFRRLRFLYVFFAFLFWLAKSGQLQG